MKKVAREELSIVDRSFFEAHLEVAIYRLCKIYIIVGSQETAKINYFKDYYTSQNIEL